GCSTHTRSCWMEGGERQSTRVTREPQGTFVPCMARKWIRKPGRCCSGAWSGPGALSNESKALRAGEAREHLPRVVEPKVAAHDFIEDASEVGRDGEVASLVALLWRKPWPPAVDPSASHAAADDHHRVAVPVVRAAVAVLHDGAAELRHREDHDVLHAIAEVAHERGDAVGQIVEPRGQEARRRSLVDVVIPIARFGERDLEANVSLDELCNLAERLAVWRAGVLGAVLR